MRIKVKARWNPYKPGDKIRFVRSFDNASEAYLIRGRVYTVNIACHGKFINEWRPCVYVKGIDRIAFDVKVFKKVK